MHCVRPMRLLRSKCILRFQRTLSNPSSLCSNKRVSAVRIFNGHSRTKLPKSKKSVSNAFWRKMCSGLSGAEFGGATFSKRVRGAQSASWRLQASFLHRLNTFTSQLQPLVAFAAAFSRETVHFSYYSHGNDYNMASSCLPPLPKTFIALRRERATR